MIRFLIILALLFLQIEIFAQTTYTYDALNRLTQVSLQNGASFTYGYDNNGNRTSHTVVPGTAFPINLLSFTGLALPAGNQLDWQTSGESTEGSFWVERKVPEANEYIGIGLVERQISEGTAKSYRFLDASAPAGRSLYRLKMVDVDGTVSYSNLVELFRERGVGIQVFPNPATRRVTFRTLASDEQLRQIEMYDMAGRLILDEAIEHDSASEHALMLTELSEGVYMYQVVTTGGRYTGLLELIR